MRAQIVLAHVTRARPDLAHLRAAARREANARADGVEIRRGAAQVHEQRVSTVAPVVAQQLGVLPVVIDEDVEVAVVVDVADREPPADTLGRERRTGLTPDFAESPIRQIPE